MTAPDERGLHDLRSLLGRTGTAIALIAFVAFAGNGMLFPVLPLYLDHLGASGATVGLALALLGLGEGLFGFLWGAVTDRSGVLVPLAVFTFGSAAGYVALALLPMVAAVLVIRLVLAALGAAIWPAGRGYFVQVVPARSKGLAMAAFGLLIAGGMSLGGFLSGAVVEVAGFRGVFLALALGTGLVGLAAVPRLPHPRAGPPSAAPRAPAMRAILSGPVLTVGAIVTFVAAAYGSVISFVPLLMASAGLPPGRVGVVFGVGTATSLLILPYAGHLADRAGRRTAMVGGLLAYVLAIFALGYARGFWPILLVTTAMFVSRWASDPAMVALLSDVVPPAFQGRAQGLHVIAFDLGLLTGPTLAGVIWDRSGAVGTFTFAAALAAGALLVALVLVREREWRGVTAG